MPTMFPAEPGTKGGSESDRVWCCGPADKVLREEQRTENRQRSEHTHTHTHSTWQRSSRGTPLLYVPV